VRSVRLPTAMLAREVKGLAWSPERLEARGNGRVGVSTAPAAAPLVRPLGARSATAESADGQLYGALLVAVPWCG